jgi:hypothetical protein
MKKITFLIILVLITYQSLPAPGLVIIPISMPEAINPYEPILRAVARVESGSGVILCNEKENAVGWFGIREVRLRDYNQRTGKNITLDSCYNYQTGRMIFLYYACRFKPGEYRLIARDWNKSVTERYWNRVNAVL